MEDDEGIEKDDWRVERARKAETVLRSFLVLGVGGGC